MSMLILDSTVKTIKAKLGGTVTANQPVFVVSYADNTGSALTEGSNDGVLNNTTDVTLVAAPASSTRRIIKSISVYNKDTADIVLTVIYDNDSTQREIVKVTLAANEVWTLNGTYSNSGKLKTVTVETIESHSSTHESGGADEINVTLDMISDFPNYSGATEKESSSGALTIGFTDSDPVNIYTLLDEAITSLTFTTTGAVIGKCIDWTIKNDYAIDFGSYNESEGSSDYGGVYAIVQLKCVANPTDGSADFWYSIINVAS